MQQLPAELVASFERRLESAHVPQTFRAGYHKLVRFYLYFCENFGYPATAPTALGPFLTKLADKNHSIDELQLRSDYSCGMTRKIRIYKRQYDHNRALPLNLRCSPLIHPVPVKATSPAVRAGF